MDINKVLVGGKMNKDADERYIPNGDYRDATNIRVLTSQGSDTGALENTQGNIVLSSLGLTNTLGLGSVSDEQNEKVYWFITSDEKDAIVEYDKNTQAVVLVLEGTSLNLTRIRGANIISGLLFWIDETNEPRKINIERAKTYGLDGFTEAEISVLKSAPNDSPIITLLNTGAEENNIEEKFLQFSYRYEFLDGEQSALAPFTNAAFRPLEDFEYDFATNELTSMVNRYNAVDITFDTGDNTVTDIELVFKESGSDVIYSIETFNKERLGYLDNEPRTFQFDNSKIYQILPERELTRFFDNVPRLAYTQDIIGRELAYGNYVEQYDIARGDGSKIELDYTVGFNNVAIPSTFATGQAQPSNHSNRDYEVAIAYKDIKGRYTTPLTSKTNTIYIPQANSTTQNLLTVEINHDPPAFATHFCFFIKQNRLDYETHIPTQFYEDGAYRWVKLENADREKIKENDLLVIKSDTEQILTTTVYAKVLEVTEQPVNFISDRGKVEADKESGISEESGLYYKIKPEGFNLNRDDWGLHYEEYSDRSDDPNAAIKNRVATIYPPVSYATGLNDLTHSGAYTGDTDERYHIEIDGVSTAPTGSVELTGGAAGSVDGITVNGVQIMSGAVPFNTDLDTTASDVADNINNHNSVPEYTATSAGAVVTIISATLGTTENGFAVVSTVTTITTTDTNLSGGADDTFGWSLDEGDTFEVSNIAITGGSQLIEEGLSITFDSTLGHTLGDYWIISAKEPFPLDSTKAYALYPAPASDKILAGARINIYYKEGGDEQEEIDDSNQPFIASQNYANLEEWYYGDDIESKLLGMSSLSSRVRFRRGFIESSGNDTFLTQDDAGVMTMTIRSKGEETGAFPDAAIITNSITVFQNSNGTLIVFETKPTELDSEIFFEVSQTYAITGGFHEGNSQNQTGSQPAISVLGVFNCFAYGNGIETYKIRDNWNAKAMRIDTRPLLAYNKYKEERKEASITYSESFVESTNFNGLNVFNLSKGNWKDLNNDRGSIQKIFFKDDNVLVLQENKVGVVFYRKTEYINQEGSSNVVTSDQLLGAYSAYKGDYGISLDNETFAYSGNNAYWVDSRRGAVLRLGQSGIEEISKHGMFDYFKDILRANIYGVKYAAYDNFYDEYILHIKTQSGYVTLAFNEVPRGWTSFYTFEPESMVKMNNRFYSFKAGELYEHNSNSVPRQQFYGANNQFDVTLYVNDQPNMDKVFKTFSTQSNAPFDISMLTNLTNGSLANTEFIQRESFFYSDIRQNEETSDYSGHNANGIGVITGIFNSTGVLFDFNIPKGSIAIGDTLRYVDGGSDVIIGEIVSIVNNLIDTALPVPAGANGKFCFATKNSRIESSEIRGYYLEAKLSSQLNTAVELNGVTVNTVLSHV